MKQLVLEHDWAATPLGPMEDWPRSLQQAVAICLASTIPMIDLWGPQLIQIYNDGFRAIMADKHPGGLGQPTQECWPDAWEFNKPIYDRVLSRGEVVSLEDQKYSIVRRGFLEEAYFTVAYGPIYDDRGNIGGIFVSAVEMTARKLVERRLRTLQQLADCAAKSRSVAAAAREVVARCWRITSPMFRSCCSTSSTPPPDVARWRACPGLSGLVRASPSFAAMTG
jgi:hypothetical protein